MTKIQIMLNLQCSWIVVYISLRFVVEIFCYNLWICSYIISFCWEVCLWPWSWYYASY